MHSEYSAVQSWSGPGDILVVDDERPILDLVGEALGEAGFGVVLTADLSSALAVLRRAPFALVLADSLAEFGEAFAIDPWPALEAIRAEAGAARVVIFSAHPRRHFDGFEERGFAGFVGKPFDLDELVETLRVQILVGRELAACAGSPVALPARP